MSNKVKFGLKNCHYFKITETTDPDTGVTTTSYGASKAWPGAVSLTVDPAGSDDANFNADDGVYYVIQGANAGYTGSFESALIPEDVEINLLGRSEDDNGVIVETKDDVKSFFAFTFEVDGDKAARRFIYYRMMLSRPGQSATTKGDDGNQPQTDTINFTATPRPDDGLIKSKTGSNTSDATYNGWNSSVYIPSNIADKITLSVSELTIGDTDTAVVEILANRDSLYENMTATVTEGASVDVDLSFDNKNVIITALASGDSTITVESGDVSATISVTVE